MPFATALFCFPLVYYFTQAEDYYRRPIDQYSWGWRPGRSPRWQERNRPAEFEPEEASAEVEEGAAR